MARTPLLEHKSAVRTLGAAFIALMVLAVWLTYAVYTKKFADSVPITISASKTGLQLPKNADVKLRGIRVGRVDDVKLADSGVKLDVEMFPSELPNVPADVSALIVPKTLFGEKYVSLQIPKNASQATLSAGDEISKAEVPIEVETVLNDIYPLLETVQPADLSYTLSAMAKALDGRGERIGDNLVRLNKYLDKANPLVPQLIADVKKLGRVSDQYADVMPELGRLLTNAVVTGDTVVAKRAQLQAFFTETTALSDTATGFLEANSANLIGLAREARPSLDVLSEYSSVFPCLFKAVDSQIPRYNNLYRNRELHINLTVLNPQPTGYGPDETPIGPSEGDVEANPGTLGPNCHSLPDSPYNRVNKAPIPPFEVYKQSGVTTRHKKFRTAPGDSLASMVQPSMGDVAGENKRINDLLAPTLQMKSEEMPDVASVLVSPVLRGAEVKIQ